MPLLLSSHCYDNTMVKDKLQKKRFVLCILIAVHHTGRQCRVSRKSLKPKICYCVAYCLVPYGLLNFLLYTICQGAASPVEGWTPPTNTHTHTITDTHTHTHVYTYMYTHTERLIKKVPYSIACGGIFFSVKVASSQIGL